MVVRTDGNKVNVQMDPPLANVRIDNQVKMTAPATCPAWPKLRFSPVTQFDGTTLLATGQIPQGCSAQTYMSLLDHPGYTAGACAASGRNWAAASSARTARAAYRATPR